MLYLHRDRAAQLAPRLPRLPASGLPREFTAKVEKPGLDYLAVGLAGRASCIDFHCKLATTSWAAGSRCEHRNNGTLFSHSHFQQVKITFKTRGNGLPVLVRICCLVLDISKEQQICSSFFLFFFYFWYKISYIFRLSVFLMDTWSNDLFSQDLQATQRKKCFSSPRIHVLQVPQIPPEPPGIHLQVGLLCLLLMGLSWNEKKRKRNCMKLWKSRTNEPK